MGLCDDAVRLPLVKCTDKTKKILEDISKKAQINLINEYKKKQWFKNHLFK